MDLIVNPLALALPSAWYTRHGKSGVFPVPSARALSGGVSCTNVCLDTCPIHARYKHDTNTIQTRGYDDTCGCSWIHASKHLIRSGYKLFPASIRTFGYGLDTIGYDRIHVPRFFRTVIVYHVYPYPVDTDTCIRLQQKRVRN